MADAPPHYARRRGQVRISPIWIVPAVAILIGLWMVYNGFVNRGPLITLEMQNAEGIEAGKTPIKTRNVEIGRVETVHLSKDFSHTIIEARLNVGSERMLNTETQFWVVKPRIGREGISGLGTVLSGAYIKLQPGHAETPQRDFKVLEQPPVAPPDAKGLRLKLISGLGNSLSTGDPIFYEGLTVGRVESTQFDSEARRITHQVFIQAPYDSLVTSTTRFWTASGINVDVGAGGVKVNFESLESLIGGGITFGVPEDVPQGQPVKSGATYELYPDRASAREGSFDRFIEYVLLVEDTVRGLEAGAPVEYRGVRVGTVVSVLWDLRAGRANVVQLTIPVLIRIELQRVERGASDMTLAQWRSRVERLMKRGLRASLKTSNLLTGSLFVDINFYPNAPAYKPQTFHDRQVFPTVSTGVAQIEQKITSLLDKLNALNIEQILDKLNRNLEVSRAALAQLAKTTQTVNGLLDDQATQAMPNNLNETLVELRKTMQGFSGDSEAYQRLTTTLERLDALMQELQPMARTLRKQPNALIFDKRERPDPQPRAFHR
ncbi:intermembrane transport protein PqiB [Nitrococcus mobilis]|uniref:Paraquat-inducible protein B n=1 Tax=Nitrococcus mobilis Nb-231 TaxID=314278 RepID=A4BRM8_9GAMM|nr:intermembrane transport protein PqiB [Nitrococcus mobilis]EAR21599.1 paraquat-inducible protein B [Nitrococcus mobilis Nb-231]